MTAYEIYKWVITVCVTLYLLGMPPYFLYSFFRYKEFREWIIKMMENNPGEKNGTPDKSDGKDGLMMFFGYISGIVSIGILLGWWISGENLWEISTASGVLSGGFFGIAKIPNKKSE